MHAPTTIELTPIARLARRTLQFDRIKAPSFMALEFQRIIRELQLILEQEASAIHPEIRLQKHFILRYLILKMKNQICPNPDVDLYQATNVVNQMAQL